MEKSIAEKSCHTVPFEGFLTHVSPAQKSSRVARLLTAFATAKKIA